MNSKPKDSNSKKINKKFRYRKKRYDLTIIGKATAFYQIKEENPQFVKHLLDDLMQVEGYSITEIAFGLQLPINYIRKIADGNCKQVSRDVFLSVLSLYARVFCGWCDFHDD